jgi:hypothetical protein
LVRTCECGFDGQAFRHEFDSALLDGMAEMKAHSEDPQSFYQAYQKLNNRLADIVEGSKPPRELIREFKSRAIEVIGEFIRGSGVDVGAYYEPDLRKLCISLMKATGAYDDAIPSLDRIIEDTLAHLQDKGGFTPKESKALVRDLMSFGTVDMNAIVDVISRSEDSRFTDFLRFIQKSGSDGLKAKSASALENIVSVQSKPKAKIVEMKPRPPNPLNPLRQC